MVSPGSASAATAKIVKVLPHLLDEKGRHTLSPSLYERDAYQALLRKTPDKCSALRVDVKWKAQPADSVPLKLRLEIRGSQAPKPFILERAIEHKPRYNRWTSLTLDGASYKKAGGILAWRATLWAGDKLLAEQKSFLW